MSTYAIGDIHGCYLQLQSLLDKIDFDRTKDRLWLVGDLVNRGPNSLKVIEHIMGMANRCTIVLGNHDLHLLATAYGHRQLQKHDTFTDILKSPHKNEILTWLRNQKLCHYDPQLNCVMTHAGIYPFWSLQQTIEYAHEVETILQNDNFDSLLAHMYGDTPAKWDPNRHDFERYRFIINALTRMRYVDDAGNLDLECAAPPSNELLPLKPWFEVDGRKPIECDIIFGHWASLNGKTDNPHIFGLDTGCVWGGKLTALRLDDKKIFCYCPA